MTEPGWYHAEGDPPQTQRFWDGELWIGEPVPVQGTNPGMPAPPSAAGSGFPVKLRTLALVVSALKAIAWVPAFIFFVFLLSFTDDLLDFEDQYDVSGLAATVLSVIGVIVMIGGVLLFFQFRGAIKEQPGTLLVVGAIMAVLDVLLLLASLESDGFFITVMLAVTISQILIAVWAAQAQRS